MSGVTSAVAIGGLALSAVGAGVSAVGALQQGQAQAAAANYQAQVARNAQTVAQWKANDALARGDTQALERDQKTRAQVGAQRAALASSGTDLSVGSNTD